MPDAGATRHGARAVESETQRALHRSWEELHGGYPVFCNAVSCAELVRYPV